MAALKAFIAVAAIAVLVGAAAAAENHTVGAPGGTWDLQTKVTAWAQGQTFKQGDNLIFSYDASQHDVLEVNKADYGSCNTNSPMSTHTSGNDVFALTAVGSRYFICGKLGHCSSGMKIEVNTVAASGPSPPGSSPSPPGSSPSPSPPGSSPSPPTGTSPPPPPSGTSKTTVGFGLGVGMLLLLALYAQ